MQAHFRYINALQQFLLSTFFLHYLATFHLAQKPYLTNPEQKRAELQAGMHGTLAPVLTRELAWAFAHSADKILIEKLGVLKHADMRAEPYLEVVLLVTFISVKMKTFQLPFKCLHYGQTHNQPISYCMYSVVKSNRQRENDREGRFNAGIPVFCISGPANTQDLRDRQI